MSATADALMGIFGFKRVEGEDMKTDRELLELAARAAGIDAVMTQPFIGLQIRGGNLWNPLTDDGDAIRLAVALKINTGSVNTGKRWARIPGEKVFERADMNGGCALQATRRAIVRAAAAIGEAME